MSSLSLCLAIQRRNLQFIQSTNRGSSWPQFPARFTVPEGGENSGEKNRLSIKQNFRRASSQVYLTDGLSYYCWVFFLSERDLFWSWLMITCPVQHRPPNSVGFCRRRKPQRGSPPCLTFLLAARANELRQFST